MVKTLAEIDTSDTKELRKYEDLLRKRLKSYGYRMTKGKTFSPNRKKLLKPLHDSDGVRGFRITDTVSGAVISGVNFNLNITEVEKFWMGEFLKRCAEKQKIQHERYLEKRRADKEAKYDAQYKRYHFPQR